ncbi:MAG: quinolinate synthase [Acidobacteria bacterium]|nr:quinolinate synthase [Acidobacteriota bacterium]|tara:strand:+ start:4404 stop:5435 length:1032 start_codon:yes stop_codon:yes gene_type:complete
MSSVIHTDAKLEYTPEVAAATAELYERVRAVVPEVEWPVHAPYVDAIERLKAARGAVVLAHNYQTPEIFHGVADLVGDSLALAKQAAATDADVIVMCGVHFMAETAKMLSPDKTVLIPDLEAGCSLAASITGADVRLLRERYPGVPVVTYVNTSVEVKAESDICCTSSNAVEVVESLGADRVIFLPDEYLGRYVAGKTDVEVVLWQGHCEVHERFTAEDLRSYRDAYPGVQIYAHPECPPDVLAEADYVGSTSGLLRHVDATRPDRVVLVTECSMSDNVAVAYPEIEFIRPCNLCPHMKQITLPGIYAALRDLQHEVLVDPAVAARGRTAVERMLRVGRGAGG